VDLYRGAGRLVLLIAVTAHVLVAWHYPDRASIVLACSCVCAILGLMMIAGLAWYTLRLHSSGPPAFSWPGTLARMGLAVMGLVLSLGFFVWALHPGTGYGGAIAGYGMLAVLALFLGAILTWVLPALHEPQDS
jgi:hypothetical protein